MSNKDRYYCVFCILLINGIGTLLPWNMFITANDFFVNHKFNSTRDDQRTHIYKKNFLAYVGVASKVPNVILQALNFLHPSRTQSLFHRIKISLIVQMTIFLFTIVFAIVDTSKWIHLYFTITVISIVVLNMANGVYQNCLFGSAANLPKKYTNIIITGMNISGTYSSIVLIFSIAIAPNPRVSAIYYFSMAVIFLIICSFTINILQSNKFYRFHHHDKHFDTDLKLSKKITHLQNLNLVWVKIRLQCLNTFMVQFVTLNCFPAIVANTRPFNNLIDDQYFTPVFCFLSFNTFAIMGTLLTELFSKIKQSYLNIFIYLRFLFIPYFLTCNYNLLDRKWPVYLNNDYYLIFGVIVLALTSGYCMSMQMIHIPTLVESEHAPKASMIASFFVITGVLAGVSFSTFFAWLVTL